MLEAWRGRLGDEYTKRNEVDPQHVGRIIEDIVTGGTCRIEAETILEVGCNRGTNLLALRSGRSVIGVEPNLFARRLAIESGLIVLDGEATSLPFDDRTFDLVLSAGLLIHIPQREIEHVLSELDRVTRHLLLTIEYEAEADTALSYHSLDPGLWKRPYDWLIEYWMPEMEQLRVVEPERLSGGPFDGCTARLWKRR